MKMLNVSKSYDQVSTYRESYGQISTRYADFTLIRERQYKSNNKLLQRHGIDTLEHFQNVPLYLCSEMLALQECRVVLNNQVNNAHLQHGTVLYCWIKNDWINSSNTTKKYIYPCGLNSGQQGS